MGSEANTVLGEQLICNINADQLTNRLQRVENPDWYLELLGLAMEEARDDIDKAMDIADDSYEVQPHPPRSVQEAEDKAIADALALNDYAEGAELLPGSRVVTALSPFSSGQPINVGVNLNQQAQPINITMPPIILPTQPAPQVVVQAPVTVNVPEQPPASVNVNPTPVTVQNNVNPTPVTVQNNIPEPKPVEKTAKRDEKTGEWTITEKPEE